MTRLLAPWSLAIAAAVISGGACSARSTAGEASPYPATRELSVDSSAMAKARADSARYPYTEADVHFMSAMIGHHSQAILMAGWAPTHGASPSVLTLAERIVNGQQDEIGTMQQWLLDRGKPIPEVSRMGITHSLRSGQAHSPRSGQADSLRSGQAHSHHQGPMPGMLTEAQLRQLDQAQGRDFDRLFLTFMIQHHLGAVSMVRELFGTPGAARDETVFKFANDVSVDQSTEVARMERMLAALTPEGNSP